MNNKKLLVIVSLLFIITSTGCSLKPAKPMPHQPPCQLDAGSSIPLVATDVPGGEIILEWNASAGDVTPKQGLAVTYTAPKDFVGTVVIVLTTISKNKSVTDDLSCTVNALPTPTPTPTPSPTYTPSPTATVPSSTPTSTLTPTLAPSDLEDSWVTPPSGGADPLSLVYQAEELGNFAKPDRANAWGKKTALLKTNDQIDFSVDIKEDGFYTLYIRHSNDNLDNQSTETLNIFVDGNEVGVFTSVDTGNEGKGWNIFSAPWFGDLHLSADAHVISLRVSGGDEYGIEIDAIVLKRR